MNENTPLSELNIGDVVISGKWVGALRYLGPIQHNATSTADYASKSIASVPSHKNSNSNNHSSALCGLDADPNALFAGIELTENRGDIDGSITATHARSRALSLPTFANISSQNLTAHERDSYGASRTIRSESLCETSSVRVRYFATEGGTNYGILLPADQLKCKLSAWDLLKKLTQEHAVNRKLRKRCENLEDEVCIFLIKIV